MVPEKFGIWEVEEKVGEGAFGIVYRCRDPFLKKHVAIKALKSQLIDPNDPTILSDFFKEAQLLAHFHHPAFTQIFFLNPNPPWIAMEFLHGETLECVLQRKEQVSLDLIARTFQAVCDGLHHIHSQVEEKYRTIHRDLKPANILLTRDGGVKIVDFGVAKANIGDPTLVGVVKGTPLYMSPEHMAGTVDSRSDLWSLAVILFETLTGIKPYPDPDPDQAWSYAKLRRFEHSVLNDRYAPLPGTMPFYLKEPLTSLFDRVFQLDKEKRLQSALEFRASLEKIVQQTSHQADPREVLLPPPSEVDILLIQAGDFFDKNDLAAAREVYELVLRTDPDNEEAHHWLLQIEDRQAEAASAAASGLSATGPPPPAGLDLPAPEVELLRRVLRRPQLGLSDELTESIRNLLPRIDEGRGVDREALRAALNEAREGVVRALQGRVAIEAETARAGLLELEPLNPEAAHRGKEEVERAAGAASFEDPLALADAAARMAEARTRAGEELADAAFWLHEEAAGVASHLELLLLTRDGDTQSSPQALQEGQKALAALQASASNRKPAELLVELREGAAAIDRLRQEAGVARLERQRKRLHLARAAVEQALPGSLAASLSMGELRDEALLSARAAMRWEDPSRLAAVSHLLEDLAETIGRTGAELRAPQPDAPTPRPPALPPTDAKPPQPVLPAPRAPDPRPPAPRHPTPRPIRGKVEKIVEPPVPNRRILWWGLAGTATIAAAVLIARFVIWPPVPAPTDGVLIVDALPWGHVREIVDLDRSAAVPVSDGATTPVRLSLPPGRYRVTVSNPDFGEASAETDLDNGDVRTLSLQLPRFDVERLLKEF